MAPVIPEGNEATIFRRKLLTKSEVVVSVPATLVYSPNYSPGAGGVAIVGTIPPRLYVGVSGARSKPAATIQCRETYTYVPELGGYQQQDRRPVKSEILGEVFKELGIKDALELTIWSEFPFRRGLNADASVAVAIAAAMTIFAASDRATAVRDLNAIAEKGDPEALRATASSLGSTVFSLAIRLESAMYPPKTYADGHFALAALLDSTHAIVFSRRPDPIPASGKDRPDWWMQKDEWWASQIEKLSPEAIASGWPVAIALWFVAHGDTGDGKGVLSEASFNPHVDPLERLLADAKRPIYGLRDEKALDDSPQRALLRAYRQACVACSVKVLQTLKRALTDGSNERILAFCDSQDRCQGLLRLIDRSPGLAQAHATLLASVALKQEPLPVPLGARLQEYGRHGYLLVVGQAIALKEVIEKAEESAQNSHRRCHWYFEPEDLTTTALRVELGVQKRLDFRILRNGAWSCDNRTQRESLEEQRLHLLVRGELGRTGWVVAACPTTRGAPNRVGETYSALSASLERREVPRLDSGKDLKSLPTLGALLAQLSETGALAIELVPATTGNNKFNVPPDYDRTSINNAAKSGNTLIEAITGLALRADHSKKRGQLEGPLTFSIDPDNELVIGVEVLGGAAHPSA